jgi:Matrixin
VDTARRVPPDGARRSHTALGVLLACVLTALLVAALLAVSDPSGHWWSDAGDRIHPALPADAASAPLARPERAPSGIGGYRFLEFEDDGSGHPVRWDPCRPIHYVVRPDGAPAGGQLAITLAITRMQQVTGLRFSFDGDTHETPRPNRPTVDVARYGSRWSPVLIAWTTPAEYPAMKGYAGLGGPETVAGRAPGQRRYVSGVILLNRDHLSQVVRWEDGQDRLDAVVLHEFGHLVGLDHVTDPAQLMFKQPTPHPGGFGDGDRRGLARLSGGPCFRDF